jgi:nucleoside-diphosphate-sugar epimerase
MVSNIFNTPSLPGDGESERMFLYDEDFAKVILDFVCQEKLRTCRGDYIVSGYLENSIKIRDLANLIANKVGNLLYNEIHILFENRKFENGQLKKPCSNTKLLQTYANVGMALPFDDDKFSEKMDDVIEWFVENYETYPRK